MFISILLNVWECKCSFTACTRDNDAFLSLLQKIVGLVDQLIILFWLPRECQLVLEQIGVIITKLFYWDCICAVGGIRTCLRRDCCLKPRTACATDNDASLSPLLQQFSEGLPDSGGYQCLNKSGYTGGTGHSTGPTCQHFGGALKWWEIIKLIKLLFFFKENQ